MRVPVPFCAAAPLLLAGALLVGCGDTVIDETKIEDQVEATIEKELPARLEDKQLQAQLGVEPSEKVSSVECPSDVEVEPGESFDCTVTFENGREALDRLEIVNDDADVAEIYFGPPKTEE